MHLDHEKFVDLLVETSGIEKGKVEKQLQELTGEINQALDEGEAYEVEGFGVFMALGNKVNFVPSKELETEINYKYAGMQPIELDEPASRQEDETVVAETEDEEDPFAFLDPDEDEDIQDKTEQTTETEENSPPVPGEEGKESPGTDSWGIDSYKDEESASNVFGALMGESQNKDDAEPSTEEADSKHTAEDDEPAESEPEPEMEPELVPGEDDDEEDIDPFAIAGSEVEEPEEKDTPDSDTKKEKTQEPNEAVPVITGVGSAKKKKEEKPEPASPASARLRGSAEKSNNPFLLVIVIIVALAAVGFGAYYFGFFSSQDQNQQVAQNPPPAPSQQNQNQPETPATDDPGPIEDAEEQTSGATGTEQTREQVTEDDPPTPEESSSVERSQTGWGLTGSPDQSLNSGYTIVLYSLSNEENAVATRSDLEGQGYRAMVLPVTSAEFGTLWRVSIGQFKTISDAAFAMDSVDESYKEDYFITKIN